MNVLWLSRGYSWKLQCKRGIAGPTELYKANYLVAVSLRNRKFSNKWIKAVALELKGFDGRIFITLVDSPYFQVATSLNHSVQERKKVLDDLKRQRKEQLVRLHSVLEELPFAVKLTNWDKFSSETCRSLTTEIMTAFAEYENIRSSILSQVKKVYPAQEDDDTLLKLANFFLTEIPVLADIYYRQIPSVIDVYPGPQAQFFWDLDQGKYCVELPILSNLAKNSTPHTYLQVTAND